MTSTLTLATWKQLLRGQAEHLIAALAAMPVPSSHVELTRAARCLITLDRMIHQVFGVTAPKTRGRKEAEAEPEATAVEVETPAPPSVPLPMNRQQRRLAEALARKQAPRGKAAPDAAFNERPSPLGVGP